MSVRGALELALGGITFAACDRWPNALHSCCNGRHLWVFVGNVPNGARLADLRCGGDESRACCTVPAFGQTVVATGKVVEEEQSAVRDRGARWALAEATLCTEDSPAVTPKSSKH